jgi:purine-binding chemotaxis protein CheW
MHIYDHFSPQEREVLRKRAERLARPIEDQQVDDALDVLIVSVGSESYAIPTDFITGVYEDASCVAVPCVPPFVAGITNIRGHIIPVLDLASFLNIASKDAKEAEDSPVKSLVVISHNDLRVALAVTEAGVTQTVSAASFTPIPDSTNLAQHGHLTGLLPGGTALLSVEAILNESLERIESGGY